MLDIAPSELLLVAFVALVVIGPKDLPKAMRVVGYWVGKARGVARQFRSGFDEMVREAELVDMEKKWAAENERIMREHPAEPAPVVDPASLPDTPASDVAPVVDAGHVEPVSGTSPDHAAPHGESVSHDEPGPVTVEKPVVVPASQGATPPRGDGVTS